MRNEREKLISEFAAQIEALVERRAREMIDGVFDDLASEGGTGHRTKRYKKPSSPKVARLRKLQGQYMGFIRPLNPADKATVKAIKDSRGLAAGVAAAKKLRRAP